MLGKIGMGELLVILVIVLIVFGPSKLPGLAKSMGQAVREFRKETQAISEEFEKAVTEDVAAPKAEAKAEAKAEPKADKE